MQKATYKCFIHSVCYICTDWLDFSSFSYDNSRYFFKALKLFVDGGLPGWRLFNTQVFSPL